MNAEHLQRLRAVVELVAREARVVRGEVEYRLGFAVGGFASDTPYESTPQGSTVIGIAGGDGVHFCSVDLPEDSIVVMVSPAAPIPHLVVGDSTTDFLRLGYFGGFAWIEELAYPGADGSSLYVQPGACGDELGQRLLGQLRSEFRLAPVEDIPAQVRQLNEKHLSEVQRVVPKRPARRRITMR